MIKDILKRLRTDDGDADEPVVTIESRRQHSRMEEDFASIIVNGDEFAVKDWSRGGVYFRGVNNRLKQGDHVLFTLKFSLPHEDVAIAHSGHITRRHPDGFALVFDAHTNHSRRDLARVMDGVLSRGFANSALDGI